MTSGVMNVNSGGLALQIPKMEADEKKNVIEKVFQQYNFDATGELTPIQVQILHGDMRMGGISFPQVLAAMKYVCATKTCHITELEDLLQEMDRRYFLLQDLKWEYSFLDREQKQSITVEQARWLVQTVHGKYFSRGKWNHFVKSRAIPTAGVTFAEIEVMLCEIPSRQSLEEEEREREILLREKEKRKEEEMEAARLERDRKRKDREEARKKLEKERESVEQDRRRKEDEEDERRQQEKKREEEEELERLRRLAEEEERKRQEEENMYKDAELQRDLAEKAEKEADDELAKLHREKEGADERRRKQLEEEEDRQNKKKQENQTKRIRYQLKVAIKSRDKYQLEYSIGEFKRAKLSDDEMDLKKAKKLLTQLSAKEGLHRAMSKREIQELEQAMAFVRKHGFEVQLAKEMMDANHLLSRLRRLERIRHEILELKQATVAEIRSYQNPPIIVHTVMTGTFLLLGHKEKETKDWKAVQSLVGKTGKESLKRRCLELDATKLSPALARKAKKLLDKFELDEVRDISAGAATFFVWATAMIEESLETETHEAEKARQKEEEQKAKAEEAAKAQREAAQSAISDEKIEADSKFEDENRTSADGAEKPAGTDEQKSETVDENNTPEENGNEVEGS